MKSKFQGISGQFVPTSLSILLVLGLSFLSASCYTVPEADPEQNNTVTEEYVPPSWAPPYDDVSQVRYYYFPDNEMYYDLSDREFWYFDGGGWVSSYDLPPMYANYDLSRSYVVLIDRDQDQPWRHHSYYHDNYPRHSYDDYKNIVEKNRIIKNVSPNHELVPRAYNENTNRVTFMQRPTNPIPRGNDAPTVRGTQPNEQGARNDIRQQNSRQQQRQPEPQQPAPYDHVAHEVPMKLIAPKMPPQSQNYNYGRGVPKRAAGNTTK